MTETSLGAGGIGLSGFPVPIDTESAQIDRLIDLLLALEPFEVKQSAPGSDAQQAEQQAVVGQKTAGADIAVDTGRASEAAKLSVDSTRAMLTQMRAVLDREAARLGEDGAEGKAAVDQVALIARTLEKIDQMERLIAEDQARARSQTLSGAEREQMRQTVRQLILSAAERMVAEREDIQAAQRETEVGADEDGSASRASRLPLGKESSDPADTGSLDPGSSP